MSGTEEGQPAAPVTGAHRKTGRALDLPLTLASVLFLAAFVASLLLPDSSPHQVWLDWVITGIWVLFAVEFLVRLAAAPKRREFIRHNWLDLLAVGLPVLRGLRMVRAFRAMRGVGTLLASTRGARLLSLSRVWLVLRHATHSVRQFLRASRFTAVLVLTVLVVVLAATAVVRLEHGQPGANILTFGDALWWSAALVTTVASEKNPVTGVGRTVAVMVMIYGMGVFGYFMSCAVVFIQGRRTHSEDRHSQSPDTDFCGP